MIFFYYDCRGAFTFCACSFVLGSWMLKQKNSILMSVINVKKLNRAGLILWLLNADTEQHASGIAASSWAIQSAILLCDNIYWPQQPNSRLSQLLSCITTDIRQYVPAHRRFYREEALQRVVIRMAYLGNYTQTRISQYIGVFLW